jgi:catalase
VKLGTITITKVVGDQSAADKKTLFLPGQSHSGIEAADPMLILRDHAYPISYKDRR